MPEPLPAVPPRASERAFGVVELMVVVLIILALGAIFMKSMNGTKQATKAKEATATGTAYAQAITLYQADHANKNPRAMASDPTRTGIVAAGANGVAQQQGPIDLLGKPYLKGIPAGVSSGRVGVSFEQDCGVGMTAPAGAGPGHSGWVSVCYDGTHGTEPGFGVRVIAKGSNNMWNGPGSKVCWLGNTPQAPRC